MLPPMENPWISSKEACVVCPPSKLIYLFLEIKMDLSNYLKLSFWKKPGCEKQVEGELLTFLLVCWIKQGEMEGSAKYLELLRMAEHYFQQSVNKPER